MLDIIDAQLALSTAKLNYISAQYDYARYKAMLETMMGVPITDEETNAADKMRHDIADIEERLSEHITLKMDGYTAKK